MTSARSRRKPTISDVAEAAGVSRATVSRVINGGHWVSPDVFAVVNDAIDKIGYRVNPHARSLATKRANSVAFLLTEAHERLFEDPNFSILMRGTAQALAVHNIPLVLIMAASADERRRATEFITGGHVDGVLLVSSHSREKGLIADIHSAGVPVIACGVPIEFEKKVSYVAADDEDGARQMVHYLKQQGKTRIATITGPLDTSGGLSRLSGYRQEMGGDYDDLIISQGDYSVASGEKAMRLLLEADPTIDAVFAANDLMAAGAIDALQQMGKSIPGDVAVAGFDDIPLAATLTPALTTMRQPFDRISSEMVRLLLQVIEGERAAAISLQTDLVVRDST